MSNTNVVTKTLVRFSYANVFTPRAAEEGAKLKYSVCILIPKKDKALVKQFTDAIEAAKELGRVEKWKGKLPVPLKAGLRDGDTERPDDPTYKGHWFINATSEKKPSVVDKDLNAILDPVDFYSGCYGRISVNMYPYDTKGNKGVACGLRNIQKVEDGERLSGGATAEEDFKDFAGSDDDDLMK